MKMKLMREIKKEKRLFGFTLVELLVVMAIIGVLVTIAGGGFRLSQVRGRDTQRKSDLKQIANALELYYSDYGAYPDSSSGMIAACGGSLAPCSWGAGEFTDGKTFYFKVVPKDPSASQSFYYRVPDAPLNQKFQLFAALENPEDPDCLGGDCSAPPVAYACGGETCNFSITSPNTTPTE